MRSWTWSYIFCFSNFKSALNKWHTCIECIRISWIDENSNPNETLVKSDYMIACCNYDNKFQTDINEKINKKKTEKNVNPIHSKT